MDGFKAEIMAPTLKGLKAEKLQFSGVIFFGVMITEKGNYLLEYNLRMGDPETQAVLNLLDSDLLELIEACVDKKLAGVEPVWKEGAACCVVLASRRLPRIIRKGL